LVLAIGKVLAGGLRQLAGSAALLNIRFPILTSLVRDFRLSCDDASRFLIVIKPEAQSGIYWTKVSPIPLEQRGNVSEEAEANCDEK
jgi:hypothetical protein